MRIFTAVAVVLSVAVGHAKENHERTIEGKFLMVTGGAEGIGKATAYRFLEKGARLVVIVDKQKELGEETTKELNYQFGENKVVFIHADVTKDLREVFKYLKYQPYGLPDIVFNNAGIVNENDPLQTIRTNLMAPIEATNIMYEETRKDRGGNGCTIINMSDMYGYVVDMFLPFYKAACAGAIAVGETLGHLSRNCETGVGVMTVCPGFTNTSMTDRQMEKDEYDDLFYAYSQTWEWQSADAVALGVVKVFEEGESGKTYTIDGGKTFESPKFEYYGPEYIKRLEIKSGPRYNMF